MREMAIHDGKALSPGSLEELSFGPLDTDFVLREDHRLPFHVSSVAVGILPFRQGRNVRLLCGPEGCCVNVSTALSAVR